MKQAKVDFYPYSRTLVCKGTYSVSLGGAPNSGAAATVSFVWAVKRQFLKFLLCIFSFLKKGQRISEHVSDTCWVE